MIPRGKITGRVMLGDPKPDENFVDTTVRIYRMVDGVKTLVGTQEPFPEGWFDPEGWRRTKTGEEDESMAGPARPAPDYEELKQALREHKTVYRMSKHYHAGFTTVQKWLLAAGLIDKENKPIESGESKQMFSEKKGVIMEQEKKRIYDECAICGDTIKAHERFWCDGRVVCGECKTAHNLNSEINAEPPSASSGGLNAVGVGETISEPQTPVSEPAGSQYEPEDNDYQDEIDKAVAQAAASNFNRKAFVLLMIEAILENSRNFKAPAELTLELIDAVLVVA